MRILSNAFFLIPEDRFINLGEALSMTKGNSTIQCTNCSHDKLIKISKIHHHVTLFRYFLIAAAIGGIFLSEPS